MNNASSEGINFLMNEFLDAAGKERQLIFEAFNKIADFSMTYYFKPGPILVLDYHFGTRIKTYEYNIRNHLEGTDFNPDIILELYTNMAIEDLVTNTILEERKKHAS